MFADATFPGMDVSIPGMIARMMLVFFLVSVPWWAGGALLGAAIPRGKIGWYVRAALAVAGALTILLLDSLAWWLVVDVGGAGQEVTRRWESGLITANVAAALVAATLVLRRIRSRRRDTRQEAGTPAS
jgi:hypothetical protein